MKVEYKFADGTVSEVEVPEEIGAYIMESRKAEESGGRVYRSHNYSLDSIEYEGEEQKQHTTAFWSDGINSSLVRRA